MGRGKGAWAGGISILYLSTTLKAHGRCNTILLNETNLIETNKIC